VNVITSGSHSFSSNSSVDTYGYLYEDYFNSLSPSEHLLSQEDGGCGNDQFKLVAYLQSNATYVLVVTTFYPSVTGVFSVIVSGPNIASLNRISEYFQFFFVNSQEPIIKYMIR
jgi:hypothetical protein